MRILAEYGFETDFDLEEVPLDNHLQGIIHAEENGDLEIRSTSEPGNRLRDDMHQRRGEGEAILEDNQSALSFEEGGVFAVYVEPEGHSPGSFEDLSGEYSGKLVFRYPLDSDLPSSEEDLKQVAEQHDLNIYDISLNLQ